MESFEKLLEEAVAMHGHLCPGQVLGVRMAMIGCREVEIDEPKDTKNLVTFVEIDRCAADALQSVTGCSLGRRTMKHLDYGKLAATFVNLDTGKAVRVWGREDSRDKALEYAPGEEDHHQAQSVAYQVMPEEELFQFQEVDVEISLDDLPGRPRHRVICVRCGEGINDGREVGSSDGSLCRACAQGAYYREVERAQAPGHG